MQNRSFSAIALALAATFSVSAAAIAQESAAQQPAAEQSAATLKIQAREVVLPVTVRDKHGALVTSLKANDFTLTEDSRPQVIKSFTRESNLPFRLGLLVDTSRSVSGALDNERKAAGKFVDQMLPADPKAGTAGDEAFLIHFDHEVDFWRTLPIHGKSCTTSWTTWGRRTPRIQARARRPATAGAAANRAGAAARSFTTRSTSPATT
jgi:hypothetical protein